MTREQKAVVAGSATGLVSMLAAMWLLTRALPPPAQAGTIEGRLTYALPWEALAALPLFVMIVAIGNARFGGVAIDPTRGAEDKAMLINGRVADNTLQQFVLFLAGSLALAVTVPAGYVQIVGAAAITFVAARIVFWIGYRIDPLYRAPGFAATAYLNVGLIGAALYFAAAKAL